MTYRRFQRVGNDPVFVFPYAPTPYRQAVCDRALRTVTVYDLVRLRRTALVVMDTPPVAACFAPVTPGDTAPDAAVRIFVAQASGEVTMHDPADLSELAVLPFACGSDPVAVPGDLGVLFSAQGGGVIHWDQAAGQATEPLRLRAPVDAAVPAAGGRFFLIAAGELFSVVLDPLAGRLVLPAQVPLRGGFVNVRSMRFAPDGSLRVLTAGPGGGGQTLSVSIADPLIPALTDVSRAQAAATVLSRVDIPEAALATVDDIGQFPSIAPWYPLTALQDTQSMDVVLGAQATIGALAADVVPLPYIPPTALVWRAPFANLRRAEGIGTLDDLSVVAGQTLAPNATVRWAGGTTWLLSEGHRIYRSVDDGDTWVEAYTTGDPAESVRLLGTLQSGVCFAATARIGGGFIVRSLDGGATWTKAAPAYPGWESPSLAMSNAGDVYSVNRLIPSVGLWKSSDRGDSWQQLSTTRPGSGFDDLYWRNGTLVLALGGRSISYATSLVAPATFSTPVQVTTTGPFTGATPGGLAYVDGLYYTTVRTGTSQATVFTSPDLVTWTTRQAITNASAHLYNKFLYVPEAGVLLLGASSGSSTFQQCPPAALGTAWTAVPAKYDTLENAGSRHREYV